MSRKILIILICAALLGLAEFARAEPSEEVRVFLNNLEETINGIDTYRFVMLTENWKDNRHEKKLVRFQFKKPNLMRTDVLEGKKKGNSVVLNKEGKIRGRNSWGFKKTLKPDDKRLKNLRGSTFMNASLLDKLARLKMHILERGCKASLRNVEYEGKTAYHLHIKHKDSDNPVTGEDIWFDKTNYALLKNLKYEGETKVADTTWQEIEINIPLEDELFEQ